MISFSRAEWAVPSPTAPGHYEPLCPLRLILFTMSRLHPADPGRVGRPGRVRKEEVWRVLGKRTVEYTHHYSTALLWVAVLEEGGPAGLVILSLSH